MEFTARGVDRAPAERLIPSVCGQVAERFKAPVLKTGRGASSSWVRIPPCPPVCPSKRPREYFVRGAFSFSGQRLHEEYDRRLRDYLAAVARMA